MPAFSTKSSQLFTQRSLLCFQQQQKAREYVLITSMLNSKLGHRREYFFFFFFYIFRFWIESLKTSIPLLHFCLKKLNDKFTVNLHMAVFSMASSSELNENVVPENCIIHNYLNNW